MDGFSKVQDNVINLFKRQLLQAGITEEDIRRVAFDPERHLARGMIAPLFCRQLVQVRTIELGIASAYIAPNLAITLLDKSKGGSYQATHSDGENTRTTDVRLVFGEWRVLDSSYEAQAGSNVGTVLVRARLPRERWGSFGDGWEVFYTEDNSFMIRPTPTL